MKKTKKQKQMWIVENCVDKNGNINLSNLDFSDFDGDIIIHGWIVKNDLYSCKHKVNGYLNQSYNEVKKDLIQSCQKVEGNIDQKFSKSKGSISQYGHTIDNYIFEGSHELVNAGIYKTPKIILPIEENNAQR